MGLFFYTKKGSIISTVDLPTTEIIEPEFLYKRRFSFSFFLLKFFMKIILYLCYTYKVLNQIEGK